MVAWQLTAGPDLLARGVRAARTLDAVNRGQSRAAHSVYVILLHDTRLAGRFGLYVGQTFRDPHIRFDQHKADYKASGSVRRFGVRLLAELTEHLNQMRQWEVLDLEAPLAQVFLAGRYRGSKGAIDARHQQPGEAVIGGKRAKN
jgi:hypothetical protein